MLLAQAPVLAAEQASLPELPADLCLNQYLDHTRWDVSPVELQALFL